MKKYIISLCLGLMLLSPISGYDNLISVNYEVPFGTGIKYEGSYNDNIIGLNYGSLSGDISTTKVTLTSFGAEWTSYKKNFSGFYWGAGASYNTITLEETNALTGLSAEYEANIIYPYLNGGYALLVGPVNVKLGLKAGYGIGKLTLNSGDKSLETGWDPSGAFIPSLYFSFGYAF